MPEAVLRASRPDDATTYKALTAVASAQTKLAASGKVVVYVPYTKASKFTAQLVTASAAITDRITEPPLVVKASTDAAMLGNTLAFELVKHGGATLCSAGASASSKAAEALRVARSQVLRKGYEIGVVPQFVAGVGARGSEVSLGDTPFSSCQHSRMYTPPVMHLSPHTLPATQVACCCCCGCSTSFIHCHYTRRKAGT